MAELLRRQDKKLIYGIPQYEFILLLIVHICALLTFINNSAVHTIVGLIAIGATCLLLFNPHLYLLLPVYMIFYEEIVPISGLVGYRIYTLLVIASCLKVKISVKNIAILLFLLAYTFYSIYPYAPGRVPMCVINFVFLILYFDNYLKTKQSYRKFFAFFIFAIVLSALFGFFGGSSGMAGKILYNGKYQDYSRFLATFNDPNYLGLMFNVAIFANLCLGFFKRKRGIIALVICYIALLATLSMTAIIVNILGLVIYFVCVRKITIKTICIILIIVTAIAGLYVYAIKNDIGFITRLAYRIHEKLLAYSGGDLANFTSGRTNNITRNSAQFLSKPLFGILFGGSYITSIGLDKTLFRAASHNEFADNLLFFGLVGTVVFWTYFVVNTIGTIRKIKSDKGLYWAIVISKIVYLCYCMTLTIFPDIRLLFLFFL